MVVVVRSFCYGGCCGVLSLWSLLAGPFFMVVVVRSFRYGRCCQVISLWSLLSGHFMVVDTSCEVLL